MYQNYQIMENGVKIPNFPETKYKYYKLHKMERKTGLRKLVIQAKTFVKCGKFFLSLGSQGFISELQRI